MRHVDEYRDPTSVQTVTRQIHEAATRPWTLMEVCGGQTHTIVDLGEDEFTVGRLHPMMDNDLRIRRLEQEAADPHQKDVGLAEHLPTVAGQYFAQKLFSWPYDPATSTVATEKG